MSSNLPATPETPLLDVQGLSRRFKARHGLFSNNEPSFTALDDVSFSVAKGEIYGLVGESGSGKSTLARCVLQLLPPDQGHVFFEGHDLAAMNPRQLRKVRHKLQIVFQDSGSSLSPRRTVYQSLVEPLEQFDPTDRSWDHQRCREALRQVGLDSEILPRLPQQLSSGQKQRVALARALIAGPSLIVADEIVSSLDVSIQAQMLELINELRHQEGIAFLFISHDLSFIAQIADRVGVMYRGRIIESGPTGSVFGHAAHPYTRALLQAIPDPDPELPFSASLAPELQRAQDEPGCCFASRCPSVFGACRKIQPGKMALEDHPDHHVECLLYDPGQD